MPPARRRPTAVLAGARLPGVRLSAELPDAAVLVLPVVAADGVPAVRGELPGGLDGGTVLTRESVKGDAGELISVPLSLTSDASGAGPFERVLLVGSGDGSPAAWRAVGAAVARRAASASVAVDLRGVELGGPEVAGLAEGLLLASYSFSVSTPAVPEVVSEVTLVVPDGPALQAELDGALVVARATAAARDLVNTPSLVKDPAWLADQATGLLTGLRVSVRQAPELAEEGFGGIAAVGQGSSRPPLLVQAEYEGDGARRHVVLVGKGITFDSGGLSLKSNDGMQLMKTDMAGAAAVLCTLRAVADLRLPVRLTVLAAVAENMPSGRALRPGDVISQYGGRTVEVLNTDAEGRLVLADALAYADLRLDPDVIVDLATLTGGIPVALGKRHAGLFTNDDALARQLTAAAERSGERLWRMPLVEDYRQALESGTADLRNIGDPRLKLQGGSITAALFLREFTGGRPWAHLDIAGPAWSGSPDEELVKGGTGYGVRLLVRWLQDLAALPTPRRSAGQSRSA